MLVNYTIIKAPAPISGGIICPPEEATASTDAANFFGYPSFFIVGNVIEPVDATLAEAEPDMDPNKADEIIETFAAPPFSFPAKNFAIFMKPSPASPAFKKHPNITKIDTIVTETLVKDPQSPVSAMVKLPKKLLTGIPGWPNSPGIK